MFLKISLMCRSDVVFSMESNIHETDEHSECDTHGCDRNVENRTEV